MPQDTPHAHWSHYDETLEMASWDALHAQLSAGLAPDAESQHGKRLIGLARSSGYGDADSFATLHGAEADDDEGPEASAAREQFESYQDGDYWNCIDASENALREAFPDSSRAAVAVAQGMRDAYEEGRAQRLSQGAAGPSPR